MRGDRRGDRQRRQERRRQEWQAAGLPAAPGPSVVPAASNESLETDPSACGRRKALERARRGRLPYGARGCTVGFKVSCQCRWTAARPPSDLQCAPMQATSAVLRDAHWDSPRPCIPRSIVSSAQDQRPRGSWDGSRQALWVGRTPAAGPGVQQVRGWSDHAIGDAPRLSGADQLEPTPCPTWGLLSACNHSCRCQLCGPGPSGPPSPARLPTAAAARQPLVAVC